MAGEELCSDEFKGFYATMGAKGLLKAYIIEQQKNLNKLKADYLSLQECVKEAENAVKEKHPEFDVSDVLDESLDLEFSEYDKKLFLQAMKDFDDKET